MAKKNNDEEKIKELARQLAFVEFISNLYDRTYGVKLTRLERKYERKYEKALKKARKRNGKKE